MQSKTSWLIIGILLFGVLQLQSQNFKFGALAGIGITNLHVTDKPEISGKSSVYSPLISYNLNVYVGYKSTGIFGCSIEPGLIQKGGVIQYDENDKDDNLNIKLYYFQIPLLANFYLTDKFFASIGPEFAFLTNAEGKSKDHSSDINNLYENNFELSGILGINYNIFKNIDIGLRYSHGITPTKTISFTDKEGNITSESNEYNQYGLFIIRFKM